MWHQLQVSKKFCPMDNKGSGETLQVIARDEVPVDSVMEGAEDDDDDDGEDDDENDGDETVGSRSRRSSMASSRSQTPRSSSRRSSTSMNVSPVDIEVTVRLGRTTTKRSKSVASNTSDKENSNKRR
jgi:hypothetical protein